MCFHLTTCVSFYPHVHSSTHMCIFPLIFIHLSKCITIYPYVYPSTHCVSIFIHKYPPTLICIHQSSVYPTNHVCIHLPICISISTHACIVSIYPHMYLYTHMYTTNMCIHPLTYPSIHSSIHPLHLLNSSQETGDVSCVNLSGFCLHGVNSEVRETDLKPQE